MSSDLNVHLSDDKNTSPESVHSRTPLNAWGDLPSPVETAGEFFPGGVSIEPIEDFATGQTHLLFTNGQTSRIDRHIEYKGRTYVPINLDARMLKAVRFPNKMVDYGSTTELLLAIRQLFMDYGYPEEIAFLTACFVLSTWFPDCLPEAPCLLISGPRAEAHLLLQLLACLVRHPLQFVDFNLKTLCSLARIQPTFLIGQDQLSPSKLKLLLSSNSPNSYVPSGDGVESFYSAKAIYRGIAFREDVSGNAMLRINLTPLRGKFPNLDPKTQEEIAEKFQPMLLNHRVRNFERVRESTFDFPGLSSGVRILARILGACLTDAPKLQADLLPWFQRQQRAIREHAWLDYRCVTIEVVLALCHSMKDNAFVFVGKFTDDVNAILKSRGHDGAIEPRAMGEILRDLELSTSRKSAGYAFCLTDGTRRLIHRLAFSYDVAAIKSGKPRCEHCSEVLKADITGTTPESKRGDRLDE